MYDHILIPVSLDGSRDIDTAKKAAKVLANKGARITLLHAFQHIPTYVMDYIPADTFEHTRSAAKAELEEVGADLPEAEAVITDGTAGTAIVDWANKNEVDCIIIASHEPEFADYLLGSNAARVVRHAHCAVHVIR